MQCPLCAGPLHVDDVDELHLRCERGHEIDADGLRVTTQARVTVAFWMAIEALHNEAEALRTLAAAGRVDGVTELADQADRDATLLRELATAHLPPEYAGDGHGE
jgi:hypothetical protein